MRASVIEVRDMLSVSSVLGRSGTMTGGTEQERVTFATPTATLMLAVFTVSLAPGKPGVGAFATDAP